MSKPDPVHTHIHAPLDTEARETVDLSYPWFGEQRVAGITRPAEPKKRWQTAENLTQGEAEAAGGRNVGVKALCPGAPSMVWPTSMQSRNPKRKLLRIWRWWLQSSNPKGTALLSSARSDRTGCVPRKLAWGAVNQQSRRVETWESPEKTPDKEGRLREETEQHATQEAGAWYVELPSLPTKGWEEKMTPQELEGGNTANPLCTMRQSSQVPWTSAGDHSVFPFCCDLIQSRRTRTKTDDAIEPKWGKREMIASS